MSTYRQRLAGIQFDARLLSRASETLAVLE